LQRCTLLIHNAFLMTIAITIAIAGLLTSTARADDQLSNLHFQVTTVSQEHGEFRSQYVGNNTSPTNSAPGQNSLTSSADNQTSLTMTIFAGYKIWQGAEFYVNPELSGGSGFNKTQGIAGFPNAEIYRVDDPTPKWSLARLYVKQSVGFGGEQESIKDDKNQLAVATDLNRLTLVIGRFSLNDFMDNNSYSHDPRTQFLNWGFMDHGAWDYAADTKGYTWGVLLEYNQRRWAVRLASVMVPAQANQMVMDTNFPQNRGDNVEFEYRYSVGEKPGAARLLVFENHAHMGNYRQTLNTPAYAMDITQSRSNSVKYGAGLNLEQKLTDDLGSFLRASWNDGHTETWAFTEIDQTLSFGLSLKGTRWHRTPDVLGLGFMINGLSQDHRDYLANGGYGFMIGDGTLNYAPEYIAEASYLYKHPSGLDVTGDYQFVQNPAYNSDRGPVSIFAVRLHYEI
jgi:high affinity Mn2+ porin